MEITTESDSTWNKILTKNHHIQKRIYNFIDSPPVQVFLVSLLFISLFLADAWTLGNQPDSNNNAMYGVLMAIFIVFCMECVSLVICQKNYVRSIFFFLDALGTISIILDIGWIAHNFLPNGSLSNGAVLRSTRAAKLGARYGRLMRILKMTRFLKYLPCFKVQDAQEAAITQVRRVTTTLIAKLSQHIAAVIMIAVIVVPFLNYSPEEESPDAWLENIKLSVKNPAVTWSALNAQVEKCQGFFSRNMAKLLSVQVSSPYLTPTAAQPLSWKWHTRSTIRDSSIMIYESNFKASSLKAYSVTILMDMTEAHQRDSMLGILLVILVIFLLCGISTSLQVNIENMIVAPLEKMTAKLMNFATDMLRSWKATFPPEQKHSMGLDDEDEDLEDLMLEKMIEKIGRLIEMQSDKNDDIELIDAEGLDENTKTFLTKSYSKHVDTVANDYTVETDEDDGEQENRLTSLLAHCKFIDVNKLNDWSFDVLDHTHEELFQVFVYIYALMGITDQFKIPKATFAAFMKELSQRYVNTNTYHNFHHGCDVAHTVYRLIMVPSLHLAFSHLEVFSIITAALAHDVGHPGVNNVYLVKAKSALALSHNDKSPLENMHCVVLYEILAQLNCNIFVNLTDSQWRESRKIILTSILATDMNHHMNSIKETKIFGEIHKENIHQFCLGEVATIDALAEEKNRIFLLELCLHCADISNPYKAWKVCERWADLVIEEFCQQGDRERLEGLEISPMCDRATINLVQSQMGFIEFVVTPLIVGR